MKSASCGPTAAANSGETSLNSPSRLIFQTNPRWFAFWGQSGNFRPFGDSLFHMVWVTGCSIARLIVSNILLGSLCGHVVRARPTTQQLRARSSAILVAFMFMLAFFGPRRDRSKIHGIRERSRKSFLLLCLGSRALSSSRIRLVSRNFWRGASSTAATAFGFRIGLGVPFVTLRFYRLVMSVSTDATVAGLISVWRLKTLYRLPFDCR